MLFKSNSLELILVNDVQTHHGWFYSTFEDDINNQWCKLLHIKLESGYVDDTPTSGVYKVDDQSDAMLVRIRYYHGGMLSSIA